jgi:DNA repair protein RecN (Recombination protein N)
MLSQLSVKNLAVVEYLDLCFEKGMSSVTGETGSGKSVLLQALNFALGSRGDSSIVRHGKSKAEVSAVFLVDTSKKVQLFLKEFGLEDEGECVLRRVISSDGRSKSFVNGSSVALSTLRRLGEMLIDMHGQNEHQLLLRNNQQLELLDNFSRLDRQIDNLNSVVEQYKDVSNMIESLTTNHNTIIQHQELLNHQLAELVAARLNQDELDTIEANFKFYANANNLIERTSNILDKLNAESGVNNQLQGLSNDLSKAVEIDPKLTESNELLNSSQLQTQECIYELTNYLSSISIDEQTVVELEDRLSELHDLARKHNCRLTELIETKQNIKVKLTDIGVGSSSIHDLNDKKEKFEADYEANAKKITKTRAIKAIEFSKLVTDAMQLLGMPGSEFMVSLVKKDGGVYLNGSESVEFLVKTNHGQSLKPLKKIASGGELSRVSLAISVVSADSEYAPTLVFDEVDVGISGAIAEVVGRKLKELSQHYQVICITHLAQVASFGCQHLKVSKVQEDSGAKTNVQKLSNDDRILEVARILGGITITEKARKAAEEMIKKSA